DLLARCVLALLAGQRLVIDDRLLGGAAEVPVDADPVHLAVVHHLFAADDRNVVLVLAGDHAGVAAGAGRQIDRHAPAMAGVLLLAEQREAAPLAGLVDVIVLPVLFFFFRDPRLVAGHLLLG